MKMSFKTIAILVSILLFAGCIAIGGIESCVRQRALETGLAETQFNSTQDIYDFCSEYKIKYKLKNGKLEAKHSYESDIVEVLNVEFVVLQQQEHKEDAKTKLNTLLDRPPKGNFLLYRRTLKELSRNIDNPDLLSKVQAEFERIAPACENEQQALDAAREHAAAEQKEKKRIEKLKSDAKDYAKAIWKLAYPSGVYNWDTESTTVLTDGNVLVTFEFSVKNAFNARIQRRVSFLFGADLEILDTEDDFLYVRND